MIRIASDLTLGITHDVLHERRVGFTDLSRLLERCRHRPGQCYLPDKEFRYLRTVIVTADIHGDLGSTLRLAADVSP